MDGFDDFGILGIFLKQNCDIEKYSQDSLSISDLITGTIKYNSCQPMVMYVKRA